MNSGVSKIPTKTSTQYISFTGNQDLTMVSPQRYNTIMSDNTFWFRFYRSAIIVSLLIGTILLCESSLKRPIHDRPRHGLLGYFHPQNAGRPHVLSTPETNESTLSTNEAAPLSLSETKLAVTSAHSHKKTPKESARRNRMGLVHVKEKEDKEKEGSDTGAKSFITASLGNAPSRDVTATKTRLDKKKSAPLKRLRRNHVDHKSGHVKAYKPSASTNDHGSFEINRSASA
jgi:hypothetical protein